MKKNTYTSSMTERLRHIEKMNKRFRSPIADFVRTIEIMNERFRSPIADIARSFDLINKKAQNPFISIAKEFERNRNILQNPLIDSIKGIENLRASLSPAIHNLSELHNLSISMQSHIYNLTSELQAISKSFLKQANSFNMNWQMGDVGNSIANDIINTFDLDESSSEEKYISFEEIIQEAYENTIKRINELTGAQDSRVAPIFQNGWLNVFLSIIFSLAIAMYFSNKSDLFIEKKFKENEQVMKESSQNIIDRLNEISMQNHWHPYVVERAVNVRKRKTSNSSSMCVLYPGTVVSVIKNEHKWVYVEYFDLNDGYNKQGWVFKKHLNQLNENN